MDLRTFLKRVGKPYPKLYGCDCNLYPDLTGGPASDIVKDNMEWTSISPPEGDPDYVMFKQRYESAGYEELDFLNYDALYVIVLAIESAGEYDVRKVKEKIFEVTSGGEIVKPPSAGGSWKTIKEKIGKGVDIDYKGVSGDVDFLPNGDIKSSTYGIYRARGQDRKPSDFLEIGVVKVEQEGEMVKIKKIK